MSENKNIGYKIRRTGERALAFSGRIIGKADNQGLNSTRWTTVTLYRTASGRVVVKEHYDSSWQGSSDHVRADSFSTAAGAIRYLRHSDGDNYDADLSRVAQEAIEAAGENDAEFASAFTETI